MRNNIFVFLCLFLGLLFPQERAQIIEGVAAIVENSVLLKSDLVQMINMMAIQQRLDPKTCFPIEKARRRGISSHANLRVPMCQVRKNFRAFPINQGTQIGKVRQKGL